MAADDRAERTLQIQNELGLHVRAAGKFVKLASKFSCEITVTKSGSEVNGKSILSLMALMAPRGTTITIRARGERAEEAVAALAQLVEDRFEESR
ncbi:MAG: HPr family phosphocarrier protein [Deltaproteobacteria bacterium]|nr:MAG: HPr family phosphocarrier protein [Deltaproteobacteria bacterium]TMQ23881.1 MAG: HPr family phosphocarrier protein [Deltaproteobacteria bacterium]